MLMNRDAEIADLMLWGHLGLTLIALGAAFFGFYIAMINTSLGAQSSLGGMVYSAESLYFNKLAVINLISHNNSTLANFLINNSTVELSNSLKVINQSENQISKAENNLNIYPLAIPILLLIGVFIFVSS